MAPQEKAPRLGEEPREEGVLGRGPPGRGLGTAARESDDVF